MDLLKALVSTYDAAAQQGLVDSQEIDTPTLLPLFHDSKRSASGKDIIEVVLDKKGSLIEAEFLEKNQLIVFPVTPNSLVRTSSTSAPHLLAEGCKYISYNEKSPYYRDYIQQLRLFKDSCSDEDVLPFLESILAFVTRKDSVRNVMKKAFNAEVDFKDNIVYVSQEKTKERIDMSKVILTFSVEDYKENKRYSVSNYKRLHQLWQQYVLTSENAKRTGTCNITGEKQVALTKHRGVIGKAKLVSGSNNIEAYIGRFNNKEDIITIGEVTSEKAHLMLKYLLENRKSRTKLGTDYFFSNWFSDDIVNNSDFEVVSATSFDSSILWIDDETSNVQDIVSQENKKLGLSFVRGKKLFNDASRYYGAMIYKTSKGRVSLTYYREIGASELLDNLGDWQTKYAWPKYDNQKEVIVPSLHEIIAVAYGVEREEKGAKQIKKKLILENEELRSNLFQELIGCILDRKPIPGRIIKKMEVNIHRRHAYKERWHQVERVALSILQTKGKERLSPMLDRNNMNRSYLFGRLLAILELFETQRYRLDSSNEDRITNAQRYWAAYTGQPAKMMTTLFEKVTPYEQVLQCKNKGVYIKLEKERQEIIEGLSPYQESVEFNQALDYRFIFGYYAEKQFFYTKKENDEKEG